MNYYQGMDNLDIWVEQVQERVFDIWLPRAIGAFFWQLEHNTLLCLMFVMGFCVFSLHLISHRRLKQKAYHRGLKKGKEAQ